MIHGRNLIIYLNGEAIAAAKSCTVSMSIDNIEAASDTTGTAKTFLPTQKEWTVKCQVLVTSLTGHLAKVGDTVRLSVAVCDWNKEPTTDRLTGDAIVTSASVTATIGNLVQGNFSFRGTGTFERPVVRLRDNQGTPLNDSQGNHLYAIGQL